MKATGIIRRLDDLGRIVIPKEIRRTMNLREGDPMEIYTTNEGVVLTKYREDTKEEFAKKWLDHNQHYLTFYKARFTIEGTTVICETIKDNARKVGKAVCDPCDNFDASVGMAISLCRAMGVNVPGELLN